MPKPKPVRIYRKVLSIEDSHRILLKFGSPDIHVYGKLLEIAKDNPIETRRQTFNKAMQMVCLSHGYCFEKAFDFAAHTFRTYIVVGDRLDGNHTQSVYIMGKGPDNKKRTRVISEQCARDIIEACRLIKAEDAYPWDSPIGDAFRGIWGYARKAAYYMYDCSKITRTYVKLKNTKNKARRSRLMRRAQKTFPNEPRHKQLLMYALVYVSDPDRRKKDQKKLLQSIENDATIRSKRENRIKEQQRIYTRAKLRAAREQKK